MANLFSVENKKAIVTGSTRNLGYGMAEGLLENGAEVVIWEVRTRLMRFGMPFWLEALCHAVAADLAIEADRKRASTKRSTFWVAIWIFWSTRPASSAVTAAIFSQRRVG